MAIDLITGLLQLDPDRRPSAETLLGHPYLAKYDFPNDEVMFVSLDSCWILIRWLFFFLRRVLGNSSVSVVESLSPVLYCLSQ